MKREDRPQTLEPVHSGESEGGEKPWSFRLFLFLRAMAAFSLAKGLYHWAVICGLNAPGPSGFDSHETPYQIATVYFAIIDPVAGVGLWLTAPWGPVLWLTSVISMRASCPRERLRFRGGELCRSGRQRRATRERNGADPRTAQRQRL